MLTIGNRLQLFILVIIFTCCSQANSLTNEKSLAVGWELWYPYQYHNNQQQLVGLDFDIFNAIIKEAGFTVNYTELPWKRHLQYIKSGEMDVAMGASFTQERADYAFYTVPYRLELVKLYVKKGQASKINLPSLSDLSTSNYMLGVEGGYFYGKEYQELIKTNEFRSHITEVIDLEQNVQLLLKGHLDGFLVDPVTMKAFIEKYKLHGEFEPHPVKIYQDNIHIILSKKSLNLKVLERFNKAIETLISNGTIAEINARWSSLQNL